MKAKIIINGDKISVKIKSLSGDLGISDRGNKVVFDASKLQRNLDALVSATETLLRAVNTTF